jgi:hypothetical protein
MDLLVPFYLKEVMTYLQDEEGTKSRTRALVFVG